MTPYADFTYFGLLLYPLVPTILLGLWGRQGSRWLLAVTLAMLSLQYIGRLQIMPTWAVRELWIVATYTALQAAIANTFLRRRSHGRSRWVFGMAMVLGILPLVVAKFVPLLAPGSLWGFVGISYITFRSLDVLISIEDNLIKSLPLDEYVAFLLFFPTLSAGPIDRYRRWRVDWQRRRTRSEVITDLDGGLHRIAIGFLYKFVLGYIIKRWWMDPAAQTPGFWNTLSYMYAYSFYLFFDFAGYSAFAIGVGYIVGIHVPDNFNRPFLAHNIREFWNRWHMSLSFWFRDHVYMRFVMAATRYHWFRSKHTASNVGFLLSMGLMGLWHGVAPHYLAYGFYHAALLVGLDHWTRYNKQRRIWGTGPLWRIVGTVLTFNVVCFGFLIFSGHLNFDTGRAVAATSIDLRLDPSAGGCAALTGWALDSTHTAAAIPLDVYEDAAKVATVRADQVARPALEHGTSPHAFVFDIPAALKDGRNHMLQFRPVGVSTPSPLPPVKINCQPILFEALQVARMSGAVDLAECPTLAGWARHDGWGADAPIKVEIYADDALISTHRADRLRLVGTENYPGLWGFSYHIPARLRDGKPHTFKVKFAGTDKQLEYSPRQLTCAPDPPR
ncbi:MAG: hypothetical protein NVS2B7_04370 [Herpetosiphon sp.]